MNRLVIALVLMGTSVQARLGETVAECEARYGPIVEKRPAELVESDKDALVYSKEGVTVTAEYRNGQAWKVTYRMPSNALETILGAIAPEGGWSSPVMIAGQEVRVSSVTRDQLSVVSYPSRLRKEDPIVLEVSNRSFGKAKRADYDKKLLSIQEILKQRDENRPLKNF
ncbi:MAG: hypothetical protein JNJ83_22890 [Verrucomicrobiaceae bacterium]|nr:hypothetical protein [Verrucomicrobiaceae bacterium]